MKKVIVPLEKLKFEILRLILGNSYMPFDKTYNPSIARPVSGSMTSLWYKPTGLSIIIYKKIWADPQI